MYRGMGAITLSKKNLPPVLACVRVFYAQKDFFAKHDGATAQPRNQRRGAPW